MRQWSQRLKITKNNNMNNRQYKTLHQSNQRKKKRLDEVKGLIVQLNVYQAEKERQTIEFIKEQNKGYKKIEKKLTNIISQI